MIDCLLKSSHFMRKEMFFLLLFFTPLIKTIYISSNGPYNCPIKYYNNFLLLFLQETLPSLVLLLWLPTIADNFWQTELIQLYLTDFVSDSNNDETDKQSDGLELNDDQERCMNVVKKVLDEKTVLDMVITYLQLVHDQSVPSNAAITFHSCYFDVDLGLGSLIYITWLN